MQVGRENARVLEDGTVLYDSVVALGNLYNLLEAFVEKVNLQVERPSVHVFVEVVEIRIVVHWLKFGYPAITFGQKFGERGLAASYISCYCDVHDVVRVGCVLKILLLSESVAKQRVVDVL